MVDFSLSFDSTYKENMEQALFIYGIRKETMTLIIILNENRKESDVVNEFLSLQVDKLTLFLFIICFEYVTRKQVDLMKENRFKLKEKDQS